MYLSDRGLTFQTKVSHRSVGPTEPELSIPDSAVGERPDDVEEYFSRLVPLFNEAGRAEFRQKQWQDEQDAIEYHCVDTLRMAMERARFAPGAANLSGVRVRFWLKESAGVVEMHFTRRLEPVGWFMPVTTGFDPGRPPFQTRLGYVGIAANVRRRIVITGEAALNDAVRRGEVSSEQAGNWSDQLRRLRHEYMSRRYPPAIVRNFALNA